MLVVGEHVRGVDTVVADDRPERDVAAFEQFHEMRAGHVSECLVAKP